MMWKHVLPYISKHCLAISTFVVYMTHSVLHNTCIMHAKLDLEVSMKICNFYWVSATIAWTPRYAAVGGHPDRQVDVRRLPDAFCS